MTDSGIKMGHAPFLRLTAGCLLAGAALIFFLAPWPNAERSDRTPALPWMTRRLSPGDTMEFYGLRLRLVSVDENDPLDPDDDRAELSLEIRGGEAIHVPVLELGSLSFLNYDFTIGQVNPSQAPPDSQGRTRRDDGTVEITIRLTEKPEMPVPGRPIG